jgi:hypothetical protein
MNQWKAVLCTGICISSVNALVVLFLDNIYTQAISHKILERKKNPKNLIIRFTLNIHVKMFIFGCVIF